MLKKIDRMHELFGKDENHLCRECSNFERWQMSGSRVSKCRVYGVTNSEASDWAGRNTACGMFDRDYMGRKIIEVRASDDVVIPLPGQQSFFD